MSHPVIQAEGLGKRYRRGLQASSGLLRDSIARAFRSPFSLFRRAHQETFWALKDVSLEVGQGEVLGLIGRNGSGKTTLLKILSRITQPTAGWAEIHGRVGSLLEVGTGFHPELTGRENAYLSGAILGMRRREIAAKFDEIVAFAELEKFIDTPVKYYSSGMYVRLAFAVAAHLEPEILLVDEVLAVGDINFQKKCLGKMGDVARAGRTVVLVSHQLNQIRRLSHRVVWVDAGQIRQSGPTAEVVNAYEAAMSSSDRNSGQRDSAENLKARFLSWKIAEPASSSPHRLEAVGPVSFSFKLEVCSRIRHGHQGIALFDAERRLMWAFANDGLSFEPGVHELLYKFPFLPLCPRSYNWQLSLWDETGNVDLWEATPELQVTAPNYQHARDEWNGFLNIPSSLSISAEKGQP
jgi:ABC-type polysaccharide/polyol phosphate transport system ATPase subunit